MLECTMIAVTRCQILRPKCTIFHFGWGFAPHPAWGVYRAPPYHLAGFKGLLLRGDMGGVGGEEEGKGGGGGLLQGLRAIDAPGRMVLAIGRLVRIQRDYN